MASDTKSLTMLLRSPAMVYRLLSQTQVMLSTWALQPLRAVSLILLIAIVTVSGPWACLVHCRIVDVAHHRYGLHYQHALTDTANMHAGSVSTDDAGHQPVSYVPTALTIAVFLPLILVPQVLAVTFRWQRLNTMFHSIMILPPRRPPRPSSSFAF